MIGLLQRITDARVDVSGETIGAVGRGLLVLVGIQRGDDEATADRLLERLLGYRVFPDEDGKMNLNLRDIDGGLLLVPQFTLAADGRRGRRPSFDAAEHPERAAPLVDRFCAELEQLGLSVRTGEFGAAMEVELVNAGPATFLLEQPKSA